MRDTHGRFTSFKRAVKRTAVTVAVLTFVTGGLYVYISYGAVMKLDTSPVKEATSTPDTYEAFYNRKVEEYKASPAFKIIKDKAYADTDAQLDKIAKLNITNAVLTRIEQQK